MYIKCLYIYCFLCARISCEMPGWMNLESRFIKVGIKIAGRNINNLRYADDTTLMA